MIRQTGRRLALCLALALTAATGAAVPAHAAAGFGSVTGLVLTAGGEPAAGVAVTLRPATGSYLYGGTRPDGTFRFITVPAGDYTVVLEPVPGMRQYVPQKLRDRLAQVFTVREGETTMVNDTLLPQGSVAGRFVDFDGTPLSGARVDIRGLESDSSVGVTADANGNWRADGVFPGRYQVQFGHGESISQYAYGKVGVATPDAITVSANATTTVNDTALARTSVRVTATDAITGARLTSFSVFIGQKWASTESGELVLDGIQAGTYLAQVDASDHHSSQIQVTLTAGQQAQLAAVLEPQSFITARVVDAATGEPVQGFCVAAMTLTRAVPPLISCAQPSDAAGNVRIGFLRAGTYQLFATKPESGSTVDYGAQWVGANGGTGRQLLAQSIRVGRGETVTGPVIRLDRAGVITGLVSTSDGQVPTGFASVGVLPSDPHSGSGLGVPVGPDGRYTIDFLGPYDWPLEFRALGEAPQWSGQVGNRHFARHIKVNAGAAATFDFRFRPAVNVTIKVNGLPPDGGTIDVVNAITGDPIGEGCCGHEMTSRLVGPQLVKLLVNPAGGESRWVGGDDFLDAQPFWIPSSGSKTITVSY